MLVHLLNTTPCDLWMIWAARRNIQRTLSAGLYWTAIGLSAFWALIMLLAAFGAIPSALWYQRMPGARTVIFLTISLLFAVQTICWYLADCKRIEPPRHGSGRRLVKRMALLMPLVIACLFLTYKHLAARPETAPVGPTTFMPFNGQVTVYRSTTFVSQKHSHSRWKHGFFRADHIAESSSCILRCRLRRRRRGKQSYADHTFDHSG